MSHHQFLAAKTAGFKLIGTNRMVVTTGETGWGEENEGKGGQYKVTKGD